MAERILMNEFKALSQEPWVNLELKNDDIFNWTIGLIVLNPDSLFYGGYFKAAMKFPPNYPYSPPGTLPSNNTSTLGSHTNPSSRIPLPPPPLPPKHLP